MCACVCVCLRILGDCPATFSAWPPTWPGETDAAKYGRGACRQTNDQSLPEREPGTNRNMMSLPRPPRIRNDYHSTYHLIMPLGMRGPGCGTRTNIDNASACAHHHLWDVALLRIDRLKSHSVSHPGPGHEVSSTHLACRKCTDNLFVQPNYIQDTAAAAKSPHDITQTSDAIASLHHMLTNISNAKPRVISTPSCRAHARTAFPVEFISTSDTRRRHDNRQDRHAEHLLLRTRCSRVAGNASIYIKIACRAHCLRKQADGQKNYTRTDVGRLILACVRACVRIPCSEETEGGEESESIMRCACVRHR